MASEFSLGKKIEAIKAKIYDMTPYIKDAQSYVPQSEMEGKKNGDQFHIYLTDPGTTTIVDSSSGKEGMRANYGSVNEVEYTVSCKAAKNDTELNVWERLCKTESDFKREVLNGRCVNVARNVNKDCIDSTVFESVQVGYIGEPDVDAILLSSAGLDEVSVVGHKVTFVNPTLGAKIAKKALNLFVNQSKAAELFDDKYLGTCAESAVVQEALMPTIVADSARTAAITLTAVSEGTELVGFKVIKELNAGSTARAGDVFKLEGLKIVDVNGLETDKDFYVIVGKDGKIPEIRISVKGKGYKNPNAWVESTMSAGTKNLTSALKHGQKYNVLQTRTKEALSFDSYQFKNLIGMKSETDKIDALTVQLIEATDPDTFSTMVRIVVPYAVGMPDPRRSVLSYVEA